MTVPAQDWFSYTAFFTLCKSTVATGSCHQNGGKTRGFLLSPRARPPPVFAGWERRWGFIVRGRWEERSWCSRGMLVKHLIGCVTFIFGVEALSQVKELNLKLQGTNGPRAVFKAKLILFSRHISQCWFHWMNLPHRNSAPRRLHAQVNHRFAGSQKNEAELELVSTPFPLDSEEAPSDV